jgi:hypothetical protein
MIKKQVRNLHSNKPTAPRVFDVTVEGTSVNLKVKIGKDKYETIPWDDVVYQVEAAKSLAQ